MRLRPGSAKGVIFITIEDETGIANLVVTRSFPDNGSPFCMAVLRRPHS
jgi:error-prone DNA polymerase